MNHDVLYRCCENRDPYPSSKFVKRRKLASMNERTIPSSYDLNYDRKNLTSKRIRCQRNRFFSTGIIFILAVLLFSAGDTVLAYHHRFPTMAKQRLFSRHSSTRFSKRTNDNSSRDLGGEGKQEDDEESELLSKLDKKYKKRIKRLEEIVARQEVEIHRLKNTCNQLSTTSEAFVRVINLLREAGLDDRKSPDEISEDPSVENDPEQISTDSKGGFIESYDESVIFGEAPSSVIDAADAAGAAILAAMLGGKQRMLVDVRDAELSSDPETLVQFIELAILPVAAGLEGLESTRNRVKIVFPKVSQLLEYRRTMALAAPEVVALSTLGFDPVDDRDKLVVIVAPEPDDEEGLQAIAELLSPTDENKKGMQQPVVILNYHMVPVSGLPLEFVTAYHLRLLRVQYMSGDNANEALNQFQGKGEPDVSDESKNIEEEALDAGDGKDEEANEELEAAMQHAHEVGTNQGVTRAMVIRAYPR